MLNSGGRFPLENETKSAINTMFLSNKCILLHIMYLLCHFVQFCGHFVQ